jgi:hypothetical protein
MKDLKKELEEKIHNTFKDNKAYLDYLLQTKKNFLYRYLETSTDKDIEIKHPDEKTFLAASFENNMGEAFKVSDPEIKEGIKALAKNVPRSENPKVRLTLKTEILELRGDLGKLRITSEINWGFPLFEHVEGKFKEKRILFEFNDPTIFRKELALKYEDACDLFN